jgi:hypothetical protein
MKKKIGDFTINELLNYFKKKCRKISCGDCPFHDALCGEFEYSSKNIIEDVGENTLIEVEDE